MTIVSCPCCHRLPLLVKLGRIENLSCPPGCGIGLSLYARTGWIIPAWNAACAALAKATPPNKVPEGEQP